MFGIIGKKLGMTQVYDKNGLVVPVTVVQAAHNFVSSVMTQEKHGYNAVQLAFNEQKQQRLNKPMLGHYKKNKVAPHSYLKEFTTDRSPDYKVGMKVSVSCFEVGDVVDIQGVSKGKGFQGSMKRHHFSGGCDSHGNSVSHRSAGSIGMCTYPGRVIPGKKMPGQMGSETVTVKNLEIVGTEPEQNILLIKGALPGSKNANIYLYSHSKEFENRVLASNEKKETKKEVKEEGKKEEVKTEEKKEA